MAQPVPVTDATMESLPEPIRNQVDNSQIVEGAPSKGASNMSSIASVDADDPDTIKVNDPKQFNASPNAQAQTVGHEGTHLLENNMPPTEAAKIPADDPDKPYDISNIDALRQQGKTISDLPREQAATVVQKYIASGGKDASLKPWIQDLKNVKQSTIMPTKPGDPGISTAARAPKGGQEQLEELSENDVHNPPPKSAPKAVAKSGKSWYSGASALGK